MHRAFLRAVTNVLEHRCVLGNVLVLCHGLMMLTSCSISGHIVEHTMLFSCGTTGWLGSIMW